VAVLEENFRNIERTLPQILEKLDLLSVELKAEIKEVKAEIKEVKAEIRETRKEVKAEIRETRKELQKSIDENSDKISGIQIQVGGLYVFLAFLTGVLGMACLNNQN